MARPINTKQAEFVINLHDKENKSFGEIALSMYGTRRKRSTASSIYYRAKKREA